VRTEILTALESTKPTAVPWAECKLWVSAQYEGNKFYNQLRCHVDIAPFKSPWNLDAWRPDVSYSNVLAAACNP